MFVSQLNVLILSHAWTLRECAFVLAIDHFCDKIQQILAELRSDRHSLFLFLKTAIEVHLSGKLDFSKLEVRNKQTVELHYSSTDVEDYQQRLSNLSKLCHNPVYIDDELVELYLEVVRFSNFSTFQMVRSI